jgi:hypothetical protein
VSTVDPNASKPSRRRVPTATADPRVEDPSGSIVRGSGRSRGRTQRPATPDPEVKDPLARLAELDEVPADAENDPSAIPDIVWADQANQVSNGETNGHAEDVAIAPVARSTSIDAAIPTSAIPATKVLKAPAAEPHAAVIETLNEPVAPPVTRSTLLVEPEVAPAVVPVVEPRRAKPVIWRRTARPRVRRVTRVLRHIDTWSVFKVALVFNLVAYLVSLTAAVLLWNVSYRTGTIDNVEKFFEQFGWSTFQFRGGELYHNLWIAGLFVAIGLTGLCVMLATLFNLITDLVGGIRVSVLEEEVITKAGQRQTDPVSAAVESPAPPATEAVHGPLPG